jgi:hypothetical protein
MQTQLQTNLYEYLKKNDPDLLVQLNEEDSLGTYLLEKVAYVWSDTEALMRQLSPSMYEELCMYRLTQDLKPAKYNYMLNVLEEDFEKKYLELVNAGLLITETINLVQYCTPIFEDLNFSEKTEDNRFIRYAVIGMIQEYFDNTVSVNEIVSHELQQSAETTG